jgi:hypothetical protein
VAGEHELGRMECAQIVKLHRRRLQSNDGGVSGPLFGGDTDKLTIPSVLEIFCT